MKGEAVVLPKRGKSFDPVQIPKAIKDAGFTAVEVTIIASGSVERSGSGLQFKVPGVSHSFLLVGGPKREAIAGGPNLAGKSFTITGKVKQEKDGTPTFTVDDFQEPRALIH